jgi:hypothetical protein
MVHPRGVSCQYVLFAVIEHISLVSDRGHYVAYINVMLKDVWYKFNDDTVTRADKEDFKRALRKSYLTIWIRDDMTAKEEAGLIKHETIVVDRKAAQKAFQRAKDMGLLSKPRREPKQQPKTD